MAQPCSSYSGESIYVSNLYSITRLDNNHLLIPSFLPDSIHEPPFLLAPPITMGMFPGSCYWLPLLKPNRSWLFLDQIFSLPAEFSFQPQLSFVSWSTLMKKRKPLASCNNFFRVPTHIHVVTYVTQAWIELFNSSQQIPTLWQCCLLFKAPFLHAMQYELPPNKDLCGVTINSYQFLDHLLASNQFNFCVYGLLCYRVLPKQQQKLHVKRDEKFYRRCVGRIISEELHFHDNL